MKHAFAIGAMLGGAAFLFTLAAFPQLLLGLGFGLLAGVPSAVFVIAAQRSPVPVADDQEDDDESYRLEAQQYLATHTAAARVPGYMEREEDWYEWEYENDQCTPSRRSALTANQSRQNVPPLQYTVERTEEELIRALCGEDELPAVVEPEPVPVVVNRTAARFGALEISRN